MKALLALEDGTVFYGNTFAGEGEVSGEVVFNTSMTGYQEILTDPSYKGQIVTMTYPLIGNYGINSQDVESSRIQVEGFVVKEYEPIPSNWRSQETLADYLSRQGIIGIEGVDTRALTRHIRLEGAMKGVISTTDLDPASLIKKAKASQGLVGRDLVKEVTCLKPYWTSQDKEAHLNIVVLDCGMKFNIARCLARRGCNVTIVPASTAAEEIKAMNPDGIVISNGPGDPEPIHYVVDTIKRLIGDYPMFGICLGHQLLGLAFGGKTFKLKFGHRGANHPVKNLLTGKVEITAQNHGFCVDIDSIKDPEIEITHINLNDQTLEGMRHRSLPILSVQYHPEASPGPHDASYLFDQFIGFMGRKGRAQA
ncbi:MAG: glutamine-hydrolyzing carbamoyl-phosphate synthase small subunit [Deltaproteobacteria bacterium]|nr:glutamine-hydrolyzing carbamoyl-phosphate synthase small subunit [Deltaproteobacteria bacterium]MBW2073839.1 glutamine-hydrolyzing carbamoyl-phosphate synthase small subunit [Deltaproteobacteria bacterium]RLB83115.1 MAG: carbamoyl phosphate synthase small subunit [Deltaproteobacteria bacterium]